MATKCTNCGSRLGCGCQKRTTASGRSGCVKCINSIMLEEQNNKQVKK